MSNFLSCNAGCTLAKSVSLPWSGKLKEKAENLLTKVKNYEEFQHEVANQSLSRLTKTIEGLNNFQKINYKRTLSNPPAIWQEGSSQLLAYEGKKDGPVILFVPSLINRSYILDLSEKNSLMRFLSERGMNGLLLDWGEPGEEEKEYGLEQYIDRVHRSIKTARKKYGKKIILSGYCMGGLIALAETLRSRNDIKAMALLATPWDFHSADIGKLPLNETTVHLFKGLWEENRKISGQLVYQLFCLLNPWAVHDKYARFAQLKPDSKEAKNFIERETWLHDQVSLTANVAKECFSDLAAYNFTAKEKWKIKGKTIDPREVSVPAFIAMPRNDKIVPPLCAGPLSLLIPNAKTIFSDSGHIGMIVGRKAKEQLWFPLENWLHKL